MPAQLTDLMTCVIHIHSTLQVCNGAQIKPFCAHVNLPPRISMALDPQVTWKGLEVIEINEIAWNWVNKDIDIKSTLFLPQMFFSVRYV